jgi:hypothetical protein
MATAMQIALPPGPKGNFLLGSAPELAHDWPGFCARCARDYGDVAFYRFLHVPIPTTSRRCSSGTLRTSTNRAITPRSNSFSGAAC